MSRASLFPKVTETLSLDCHAVMTGTVRSSVIAFASLNRMRGRRRHDRQTESGTLGVKTGRCRNWNVFTPKIVCANFSVMYRLTPLAIEQEPMSEVTPTKTPRSEKPLFSFWVRSV